MNDLLPILSGLIVISALAVVSSSSDKKEHKEVKERKEYKPREKNDEAELKNIFGYFKKNLSVKKKPKRYHKVYSKGRTKHDRQGDTIYKFKTVSK